MTPRVARVSAVALGALLVVATPLLAGCSTVEGFIEQQTGGQVDIGGSSVPADFPAEVPLADGEILNGSAATGPNGERVWNVLMNVAAPDAPTAIAAQLEAAGLAAPLGAGGVGEQGGTLTFTNGALVVNVLLAKVDAGWTANYTVARSGG